MTAPPNKATEFAAVLLSLDDGATHSELTESLRDLVARVRDTGKTGTLTLTITVAPRAGTRNQIDVKDEIKLKLPEFARAASIFFVTEENEVSRQDPNQPPLEGIRFPGGRVNHRTGEIED